MDVMHLCRCCLRRSPDKDLTSPYQNQGKTEIYAQMLQECYNIPLLLSGLGSPGICTVCVGRLRDAHDFKRQVQWSQAELQEWLLGDFSIKGEADGRHGIYSPSRPTDERRSRSRAPPRSRSRSQLKLRGQSGSPPSKLSRQRSRPRSQSRRSRVTSSRTTSGKVSSRRRATSRSKASKSSKDNRQPYDSRRRSSSRTSRKRRRSRSHTNRKASRRSRSQGSRRSRSQASRSSRSSSHGSTKRDSSPAPSLQPENRSVAEQPCVKPEDTKTTPTESDTDPLKSLDTLPEFDPSNKQQTMTMWIRKVNACAAINGWSERQLVYNALPKLKGLAQMWYEGLPSVLFSWVEWQEKLLAAFPSKENYGQMLSDMVSRRARIAESLEDYYYDKVALINRVSEPITGRLAVECVLHGIDDRSIRLGAEDAQFCDLDNLLGYLRSVQPVSDCKLNDVTVGKPQEFTTPATISIPNIPLKCLNCNQEGHKSEQCPLPLKICTICRMVGHEAGHEQCYANLHNTENLKMDGVSLEPFTGKATVRRPMICHKCKQAGHSAKLCTSPIRTRCNRCKMVGHVAKQCYANIPNSSGHLLADESLTSLQKKCYNCKQAGHNVSQCPLPVMKCTICLKKGHEADQCCEKKDGSGNLLDVQDESFENNIDNTNVGKSKKCYKCRQKGHSSDQCNLPVKKCFVCQKIGHLANKCHIKRRNNKAVLEMDESVEPSMSNEGKCQKCTNCKQDGHLVHQCTLPIITCTRCQRVGHKTEQCYAKIDWSGNKLEVENKSFETNSNNINEERLKKCFNCKQKGHMSFQCPLPIITCTRCTNVGHEAEQCHVKMAHLPGNLVKDEDESFESYSDNTAERRPLMCFICDQEGHYANKCPLRSRKCTRCLKKGHNAEQCFAKIQNKSSGDSELEQYDDSVEDYMHKKCFNCKQEGHKLSNCPLPIKECAICLKKGHEAEQCTSAEIF